MITGKLIDTKKSFTIKLGKQPEILKRYTLLSNLNYYLWNVNFPLSHYLVSFLGTIYIIICETPKGPSQKALGATQKEPHS